MRRPLSKVRIRFAVAVFTAAIALATPIRALAAMDATLSSREARPGDTILLLTDDHGGIGNYLGLAAENRQSIYLAPTTGDFAQGCGGPGSQLVGKLEWRGNAAGLAFVVPSLPVADYWLFIETSGQCWRIGATSGILVLSIGNTPAANQDAALRWTADSLGPLQQPAPHAAGPAELPAQLTAPASGPYAATPAEARDIARAAWSYRRAELTAGDGTGLERLESGVALNADIALLDRTKASGGKPGDPGLGEVSQVVVPRTTGYPATFLAFVQPHAHVLVLERASAEEPWRIVLVSSASVTISVAADAEGYSPAVPGDSHLVVPLVDFASELARYFQAWSDGGAPPAGSVIAQGATTSERMQRVVANRKEIASSDRHDSATYSPGPLIASFGAARDTAIVCSTVRWRDDTRFDRFTLQFPDISGWDSRIPPGIYRSVSETAILQTCGLLGEPGSEVIVFASAPTTTTASALPAYLLVQLELVALVVACVVTLLALFSRWRDKPYNVAVPVRKGFSQWASGGAIAHPRVVAYLRNVGGSTRTMALTWLAIVLIAASGYPLAKIGLELLAQLAFALVLASIPILAGWLTSASADTDGLTLRFGPFVRHVNRAELAEADVTGNQLVFLDGRGRVRSAFNLRLWRLQDLVELASALGLSVRGAPL